MVGFDFSKFCLAEDHKVQDALVCLNKLIGVVLFCQTRSSLLVLLVTAI